MCCTAYRNTRTKALTQHGMDLLKMFHEEYKRNPVGLATEFQRCKIVNGNNYSA